MNNVQSGNTEVLNLFCPADWINVDNLADRVCFSFVRLNKLSIPQTTVLYLMNVSADARK